VSVKPLNYDKLSDEQKLIVDKEIQISDQVKIIFQKLMDKDIDSIEFEKNLNQFAMLTTFCQHDKPSGTPCLSCDEILKILFPDEYDYSQGMSNDIYW